MTKPEAAMDTKELVERLLGMPTCSCAGDGTEHPNLYAQAAAAITSQREHIRKQAEDIMTLGRMVYASPAECNSGCEDPDCPYSHHPQTWQDRAEVLEAENARLRAALHEAVKVIKPFAEAAPASDGNGDFEIPDGHPVKFNLDLSIAITNGDLRAARSFLTKQKAQSHD